MQTLTLAEKEQSWLMYALHIFGAAMLFIVLVIAIVAIVDSVQRALRRRRWRRANPEQQLAMIKAEFPLMAKRVKPNVLDIFQRVARREMTPEEGAMRLGEIPERDDQ